MNFSLETINEAQSKYTGVDFPKLIREFKHMGMLTNSYDIKTGIVTYKHQDGEQIKVESKAVDVPINIISSQDVAQGVLKRHQAGNTDFLTFCREIAGVGVYKWVSNMDEMTCSYYDVYDYVVVKEEIPIV